MRNNASGGQPRQGRALLRTPTDATKQAAATAECCCAVLKIMASAIIEISVDKLWCLQLDVVTMVTLLAWPADLHSLKCCQQAAAADSTCCHMRLAAHLENGHARA